MMVRRRDVQVRIFVRTLNRQSRNNMLTICRLAFYMPGDAS